MDEEGMALLSKICNVTGIILMAAAILILLPLSVPRLFGYQIYGILTGSMEPGYPAGSVVYVKGAEASEIKEGDVITFRMGSGTELVTTHRVVRKEEDREQFITKGDANRSPDADPVSFDRVIGKAVFRLPVLGSISAILGTGGGKAACGAVFVTAMAVWVLADRKKSKESVK